MAKKSQSTKMPMSGNMVKMPMMDKGPMPMTTKQMQKNMGNKKAK